MFIVRNGVLKSCGIKEGMKLRPHEMYERTFGQVRVALSKKDPGKVEITYAEVLR